MCETLVKTEEFKDSPFGRIPLDWNIAVLEDVAEIVMGQSPPGNTYNQVGKGVPLINGPVEFGDRFPSKLQWTITPTKFCKPGDILFCVRGSTTGRINIANDDFCIGRGVAAIRGKEGITITGFVELFLRRLAEVILSEARGSGSTFPSVNSKRLATTLLLLPSLDEQERIVEILDTVDKSIAHTDSLIAKLKHMKAGLLHDLLTRGLDENGQLRDASDRPEQFKDSPLGQIPKDWDVFQLSDIVPHVEYGISVSLDDEVGIPVLRMNNLKDGEVDLTDLKKSASPKAADLLLQPLDVLFNRTNSIEHVGRTAIWRGQIEQTSFASYLVRLIPKPCTLTPEYLNIWLNLLTTQILIRRYATPGVHQVNINPTNLRKVFIALPQKISEQWAIVEKVATSNTRIRTEEAYRDKIKLQKQGLMHDLLTGRVRV